MANRRFVFLGHANPHDNAFTLWLGARLSAAGFEVWSDLRQLHGGETFWNDIEDGLRQHTAVYVPILSNSSVNRERRGFHDEIAMAVQIMRTPNMERFIQPVMIERVHPVPPPLIQLNYIDFTGGWANGLLRLITALEKSGVPRTDNPPTQAVSAWRGYQASAAGAAQEADDPERLSTTWFGIDGLPPRIRLVKSPVAFDTWTRLLTNHGVPHAIHGDEVLTFASAKHIEERLGADIPVRQSAEHRTERFLVGDTGKNGLRIRPGEAQRLVAGMINRSWDIFAASRGLHRHELSKSTAWFFPLDLLGGKTRFEKEVGGIGERALIGRKGKLGVRWHFALSARFELREPSRLIVRSHVLFSQGGTAMLDSKKAQRLRKSLCKGWWNDEWRDRLQLAMAYLSQREGALRLPLRHSPTLRLTLGDAWVDVAARSMLFESVSSFQRPRTEAEREEPNDKAFDEEVRAPELPDGDDDDEDEK